MLVWFGFFGDLPSVGFITRDAMSARILVMVLCPSVCLCLSQVGVLSKRLDESSCFFCTKAFFDLSYRVLKRNSDIYKNNGTSLRDFVPNSGLRKFCHGISIVEACYRLISRKDGRPERDRRDRRLSTELTIPPSSDA